MTRKRYTKLLMSRGYDRNQAQRKAEQAQKSGHSYREAYMMDCRWFTLTGSINNLGEHLQEQIRKIGKIACAVSSGLQAFAETVAEKMRED